MNLGPDESKYLYLIAAGVWVVYFGFLVWAVRRDSNRRT